MTISLVSDAVIQFLTDYKLCELLVARGLVDEESCVKASAMLALSSVMTTPQLVEKFSQQQTSQLVSRLCDLAVVSCYLCRNLTKCILLLKIHFVRLCVLTKLFSA